jgi:hypothetical protein
VAVRGAREQPTSSIRWAGQKAATLGLAGQKGAASELCASAVIPMACGGGAWGGQQQHLGWAVKAPGVSG